MGVHDRVPLEIVACTGDLPWRVLRGREGADLIAVPNKRSEMREHRHLVLAIGVIGNRRSVEQDDIAIVATQLLKKHAPYDSVAWAEAPAPVAQIPRFHW